MDAYNKVLSISLAEVIIQSRIFTACTPELSSLNNIKPKIKYQSTTMQVQITHVSDVPQQLKSDSKYTLIGNLGERIFKR